MPGGKVSVKSLDDVTTSTDRTLPSLFPTLASISLMLPVRVMPVMGVPETVSLTAPGTIVVISPVAVS